MHGKGWAEVKIDGMLLLGQCMLHSWIKWSAIMNDYNEIANLHSKHVLETVIRYGYDG